MTNLISFIALLAIFNVSAGFDDRCHAGEVLMLLAPEDVYQKEPVVPSIVMELPELYDNVTILPSVLEVPKQVETFEYNEEDFYGDEDSEEYDGMDDDEINERSLRIAGFVGQCMVFLFVFNIVTLDIEHFDEPEEEEIVVVHKLHRAVEIQTCPLPSRQNIRIVKRLVESSEC
ncbi:Protein CBG09925 [Caenorhabditis briggsae]|uniref:Uncharacterized protein n=2 Tax=Caenorhabditis briggsae TaxID=6238 RepID=A0AAE9DDQ6_CAEBR|nr:Protein CBG09925 [Caenorhabditis briggsae]ULU01748.1 hypothetical protein L3Y34_001802 [Caenorhabditis briggsae]UMM24377.1 hypothetical protein L5515_004642 [Caenorhabditis briggsae]CAP29456.1 Protein CBG09925 [Caenorhabditis briggsae]